MKLRKLIEQLQKLEEEHGNLPVRVYADHGQSDIICSGADVMYTSSHNEEEWMVDDFTASSIQEAELEYDIENPVPFVSIYGQ